MSCQEERSRVWYSKSRSKISSNVWLPLQSLNFVCISQRCCFTITTAGSTCYQLETIKSEIRRCYVNAVLAHLSHSRGNLHYSAHLWCQLLCMHSIWLLFCVVCCRWCLKSRNISELFKTRPKIMFSISVNVKTPKYAFLVLREYNSSRCIQGVREHSWLCSSSTFEMWSSGHFSWNIIILP